MEGYFIQAERARHAQTLAIARQLVADALEALGEVDDHYLRRVFKARQTLEIALGVLDDRQ